MPYLTGMEQPDTPVEQPPKRGKKKRRLIIGLVLLILIIVTAKIISGIVGGPANGAITVGKAKNNIGSYHIDLTPTPFSGQIMSFNYPRGLKPTEPNPVAGTDVEKASFKVRDIASWYLNIDVNKTNGIPLSNDSSYKFRLQHPETYQETDELINGQNFVVVTNKTAVGFEKAAFLEHDGLRATVSLTGDDDAGTAPLQTSFDMVLSSWRWL